MWHAVAPMLAQRFTLVITDLPGYGWSAAPPAQPDHAPYTKRAMALAMVEAMQTLGFIRFRLAGHDRGGRVGYRLALDHRGRLEQLAVLDIVTTWDMWHRMDTRLATRAWHWMFLALAEPFPERLIAHDPKFFFDYRAAAGAEAKSVDFFDARALAHYHAAYQDPLRIHATCEDYRAGASIDLEHSATDGAKKVQCPLLVLWGELGTVGRLYDVMKIWREHAVDVQGKAFRCGHFLPEEAPSETLTELLAFLG